MKQPLFQAGKNPALHLIRRSFADARVMATILLLVTIATTLNKYFAGQYSVYTCYRDSFFTLCSGIDLYAPHPWGTGYKYSPTFAILFAPFAWLRQPIGLVAWNLLNAFSLFLSVQLLPLKGWRKGALLWLIALEIIISVQNFQSNALVAALFLLTFVSLERGRPSWAALCVALGFYIKIFGIFAVLLGIFYPKKGRFLLQVAACFLLLGALPLLVITPGQLFFLYSGWLDVVWHDHMVPGAKMSLFDLLAVWFPDRIPSLWIQCLGVVALLLPFIHFRRFNEEAFRLSFLASLLVWVVIFNHYAESPTFVIAVTGVAVWFVARERGFWGAMLMAVVLVFTSIARTDLTPSHLRHGVLLSYRLTTLPLVVAWMAIQLDLHVGKFTPPCKGSAKLGIS